MSIEAMKQALEALEENEDLGMKTFEAITSLRQAIAEEALNKKAENARELGLTYEQEPVAWVCMGFNGTHDIDFYEEDVNTIPIGTMLYTHPLKPLYAHPSKRVVFPTMLRKMWSGTEVQAWLDENVNKEKNT